MFYSPRWGSEWGFILDRTKRVWHRLPYCCREAIGFPIKIGGFTLRNRGQVIFYGIVMFYGNVVWRRVLGTATLAK